MNDAETLGFFTAIIPLILENPPDAPSKVLHFPPTLTARQRKIVHSLAARQGLEHVDLVKGTERFVAVTRPIGAPAVDIFQLFEPLGLLRPTSGGLPAANLPNQF